MITWQYHITWHHMTPPDITWQHLVSCDTTWYCVTSHDITWYHVTSCDTTWYHMTYDTTWYHVTSCDTTWYCVTSSGIMWQHPGITWHHVTSQTSPRPLRSQEGVSVQEEEGGQCLAEQVLCPGWRYPKILQENYCECLDCRLTLLWRVNTIDG